MFRYGAPEVVVTSDDAGHATKQGFSECQRYLGGTRVGILYRVLLGITHRYTRELIS